MISNMLSLIYKALAKIADKIAWYVMALRHFKVSKCHDISCDFVRHFEYWKVCCTQMLSLRMFSYLMNISSAILNIDEYRSCSNMESETARKCYLQKCFNILWAVLNIEEQCWTQMLSAKYFHISWISHFEYWRASAILSIAEWHFMEMLSAKVLQYLTTSHWPSWTLKSSTSKNVLSCNQAALSVVQSVCLSITPFSLCSSPSYHHEIFMSYYQW